MESVGSLDAALPKTTPETPTPTRFAPEAIGGDSGPFPSRWIESEGLRPD
jgi:hypothetical protein